MDKENIQLGNPKPIDEDTSKTLWVLKSLSVFTIFFAHNPWMGSEDSIWAFIFPVLGATGVPLFLFMSGYFNYSSSTTLLIKAKNLFLPLLFWGIVCCLLIYVFNPKNFSLGGVIPFIYGCGSYFYFVPVLFWCIVANKYLNRYLIIALSILSLILTYFDVIPYNDYFTQYTNPFNFFIYFQLGEIFRKYDLPLKLSLKGIGIALCALFLFLAYIGVPQYFNPLTIVYTVASLFVLFTVCHWGCHNEVLIKIGKLSFVICLMHLIPANIICRRFYPLYGTWAEPLKIIVAFIAVVVISFLLQKLLSVMTWDKVANFCGYK